ncbi:hypothetical protein HEQ60_04405 [Haematospirillum sp. H1815]|uniref:hypothetical protein n=1 Tax=Haematospirillum sp. H1815 TaxID=2723108 RepID=UPI00143C77A6|nr:hypothetical protein [Haematospirillum sp. H1815]NKD77002.1 hypothetical protein [Haematospirillum sp. H1815]
MVICRGLDPRTLGTLMVALAERRRGSDESIPDDQSCVAPQTRSSPDHSSFRNTLPRA